MSKLQSDLWITCSCGNPDHSLVFQHYVYENSKDTDTFITTSVHLVKRPWHKRVKVAFNYLFNRNYDYCFEEFILEDEQIDTMIAWLSNTKKKAPSPG